MKTYLRPIKEKEIEKLNIWTAMSYANHTPEEFQQELMKRLYVAGGDVKKYYAEIKPVDEASIKEIKEAEQAVIFTKDTYKNKNFYAVYTILTKDKMEKIDSIIDILKGSTQFYYSVKHNLQDCDEDAILSVSIMA